jgi:hypothetical protein
MLRISLTYQPEGSTLEIADDTNKLIYSLYSLPEKKADCIYKAIGKAVTNATPFMGPAIELIAEPKKKKRPK